MQTYLFYDIETTGLNKSFDQVLQFAAIRTTLHLDEIERHEIIVRLNRDIIPSPYALITHHIGLDKLSQGVDELTAIQHIHRLLNQPGTISLGYNTLGFDDEFLRFSFYRNLLPPYTHQFASQCSRMDLYPIALMYFLFKPNTLHWPEIDGKTTFKLEALNTANDLAQGRAHDAMVDVEATVALAKRFFKERDMWDYLKGYFDKKTEQERIKPLLNPSTMGLAIDGRLRNQHYQTHVMYLGPHQHYKNQFVWLQLDTPDLKQTAIDSIPSTTRAINKKYGEPQFILPIKERFAAKLSTEHRALAEQNHQWLMSQPDLLAKIIHHYTDFTYPSYPQADLEARLYLDGFYSPEEEQFCRLFHRATPKEKAKLTDQITSPKLKERALRILGRHFPDVMSTQQADLFSAYLKKIHPALPADALIDFQGRPRMTPKVALADILTIREQSALSAEQAGLLNELETYLLTTYT